MVFLSRYASLVPCAVVLFLSAADCGAMRFGERVEAVTGAHTRIVWMRDTRKENPQKYGTGKQFLLMGFDSRDGRGIRPILESEGSYYRPLITPDGRHVVFTDTRKGAVYSVAWDGSGLRRVAPGVAGAVWQDASGVVWVYGKASPYGHELESAGRAARRKEGPVIRYPLENPRKAEVVWDKSPGEVMPPGNLQLSAGGDAGSMTMPWPACGVAKFPDVAWIQHANGCWPSLAPDRSYVSWTFEGSHRRLEMLDPRSLREWEIDLSQVPGLGGGRAYHPRWSNHALFMAFTGPYDAEGKMVAPWPDVYLAKFRNDLSGIDASINVTRSEIPEIFPDVWIDGGSKFASSLSGPGPYPTRLFSDKWPSLKHALLFLWKNSRLGNTPAQEVLAGPPASAELSGEAFFGPDYELVLRHGSARVAGFDREIIDGAKTADSFALEFVVAAAEADRPGERHVISLSRGKKDLNFAIVQKGKDLMLFLRGSETGPSGEGIRLCTLEAGRKTHVVVNASPGLVTCYLDGREAAAQTVSVGSFSAWSNDAKLVLGSELLSPDSDWSGTLEGLAIYGRNLSADEAARNADLFGDILRRRPRRETSEVEVELLVRRDAPSLEDVAPYRRALVVNRYRLKEGTVPGLEGREILIAEWALLDGLEPKSYRSLRSGDVRRLTVASFNDHPQLQSERLISEPDELDLFVEVLPWQK